ncbi:MAG: ATP synthase F0 subunit B [Clostridia bacterium]|nr:ATP synthase F0 subunit B [Deltaproteobacteria bacterium]
MDLDVTLIAQFLILVFLLVTLNGILFKPLLGVLDARQHEVNGVKSDIERLTEASAADIEAYQTRLREARDIAQRERDTLRNQGRDSERKLLTDARSEVARTLSSARERTAKAESAARAQLQPQVVDLAKQIAAKVLGREVNG